MEELKRCHPIVNFIYFAFVISYTMLIMHPAFLLISFSCAVISVIASRQRAGFLYLLPMFLMAACINPIFNHRGSSILTYLPGGNPLTLESIIYGIAAGILLTSIILWFRIINGVMPSDKWMYLFGKIIPSLSLLISMSLRFIPRFVSIIREMLLIQEYAGNGVSNGSIISRIKNCGKILSASATRMFDNAIYTSDSMKSRGYGTKRRTHYSIFIFSVRDVVLCVWIIVLGVYVAIAQIVGAVNFAYFPSITDIDLSVYIVTVFSAYFMLCITPVILTIGEKLIWKFINSRM